MGEEQPTPLSLDALHSSSAANSRQGRALPAAGLAALIDSVLRFRRVHIITINHYVASSNTLFEIAGFTVERINSVLNGDAAHISGFLSNDEVHNVIFQIGD